MAQIPWTEVEQIPALVGLPSIEEYAAADDDPLLRLEWNVLANRAHLSDLQYRAFNWYHIVGFSLRETGAAMELDESTVRHHLKAAYSRLNQIPHHGLLTVLIETFGLSDTMDAMNSGNGKRRK